MVYSRRGFPFTVNQLCQLAYEMAKKEGTPNKFSPIKKSAGRKWLKHFFKRHPEVKKKNAVNLSIARAMCANPTQIGRFFEQYRNWIADWKLEFAPNRIWNVDECGIGDVPKPQTVVGVTGERAFQTVSGEKSTNTTMVTFASAGGIVTKPMLIFKASKVKNEWRDAAPSGYHLKASPSGYINSTLFYEYGKEFVTFLKERHILTGDLKVLLLLDLHKSHLFNYDFMQHMKKNNVEVCSFPPHCTHVLQPLDDVPFGNFKREYDCELHQMNRTLCGNKMNKKQFFRVFVPAFTTGMAPEFIRKGFENTGIYPPNAEALKLQNIQASAVYDRCKFI